MSNEKTSNNNPIEEEKELKILQEKLPKKVCFKMGINGDKEELSILGSSDLTNEDISTALATIDLALLNNFIIQNKETGLRDFIIFNTKRKQLLVESAYKLFGESDEALEILDFLVSHI